MRSSSLKAVDHPSSDGPFPGETPSFEIDPPESPRGEVPRAEAPHTESPNREFEHSASPITDSAFRRESGAVVHAFAGLQAGMAGVVRMFACFIVVAWWNGDGVWSIPNLFATVFYGEDAYRGGFYRGTWSGIALIVAVYSFIGMLWGCLWKQNRRPLLAVYGALTGIAVFYLFFDLIWPYANPLLSIYAPTRQMQLAHLLWGLALAKSPGYAAQIAAATRPAGFPVSDRDASGQEPAESVSGELIR